MMAFFTMMWIAAALMVSQINADLIKTKLGYVNGTTRLTNYGKLFKAYYGIPYALPPIGNLRFQPPVPHPSWKGILDATKFPNVCIQKPKYWTKLIGSEDCLNLVIYTPLNATAGAKIPVLFYIFGGIFKAGSHLRLGPEYFMNRDIILVMTNYRLGPLGFMSTGDEVVPGNMGLKDQSLALKWVKENIDDYGGDPNQITLFGHSSGSVCVHLHTLSPMSKGLFNQVIMMSGTGFCYLSFFDRDIMKNVTKTFAMRSGCNDTTTSQNILDCLLNMDPYKFPRIQEDMYIWNHFTDAMFRPTVEAETVKDPFLATVPNLSPYQSTEPKWLLGSTSGEGLIILRDLLLKGSPLVQELNANRNILLPITLQYLWHIKPEYMNNVTDLITHRYFHNQEISNDTSDQLMKLYSHELIHSCVNEALHRYNGTKYVYLYDYIMDYEFKNELRVYGKYLGVAHAAEISLFFSGDDFNGTIVNSVDRQFGDELINRWVNFVISGDPNKPMAINQTMMASWDPVTTSETEFLRLKINGSMESNYYNEDYNFWKNLSRFKIY